MMFTRVALSAVFASLASFVAADVSGLSVTAPSSSLWWVAQSQNRIAWTCQSSPVGNFTVLVANSDPKVLVQPMAVISIENNFDCSKLITQDQANQAPGTGYTILLADPLNNTNVYATSEPFEIKALGSAYPDDPSTDAPSGTSSSSGSAPTNSSSSSPSGSSSGATSFKASLSGLAAIAAAGLALVLA